MAEKGDFEIVDEYLDVISSEISSRRNDFLKKAGVDLNDSLAVKIANERIDGIIGDNGFRLLVVNEDWAYIVKGGREAFDKAWSHMVDMMVEGERYWCDKDWGFEQPLISDTAPKSEAERIADKLIGPFLQMQEERFASMSHEYRLKERQKCYGIVNEVIGYLNQELAPKVFNLFSPPVEKPVERIGTRIEPTERPKEKPKPKGPPGKLDYYFPAIIFLSSILITGAIYMITAPKEALKE